MHNELHISAKGVRQPSSDDYMPSIKGLEISKGEEKTFYKLGVTNRKTSVPF